ncbi:hypothetical protein RND81_06G231400 [Saponaria officinalis]|uniref:Uncharacterized protein n=1 Tax=Saponaria officinalis TaxID=3572 RepID=A0AAW1KER3_SAPOF
MLNAGRFDLNSVQFCSDSLQARLTRMILNQELAFMGQVFDLHRLYRIQTAMAEDIKRRGFDDYNSHARGVNSSHVNLNNQVQYSMSDEQRFPPGFKPKPLDLQLSADDFIRQSTNSILRGSPIESKKKDTLGFDLNVSLNIDEETSKKGAERRSWIGKRSCAPPPGVIDLEDPNTSFPNNDPNRGLSSGFPPPNLSSFRDNRAFQRSSISDKHNLQSLLKAGSSHVTDGTTSRRPFLNDDRTCQGPTLRESGFNGDVKPSDTSVSRKPMLLDLNKVHLDDDTSDLSYTHLGAVNPLATAFTTARHSSVDPNSGGVSHVNNGAETLNIHVQNNRKFGNKISADSKPGDNRGEIIFIDLGSDSDSDSHEERCSNKSDPKVESVGSSSKLSSGPSCESDMGKGVIADAEAEADTDDVPMDPEPFCQILSVTGQQSDQKLPNSSPSEDPSEDADAQKDPEPFCQILSVTEQLSDQKLPNSSPSEIEINVDSRVNGGNSDLPPSDKTQMIDVDVHVKNKENKADETDQKAGELLVELSHPKPNSSPNSKVCRRKERDRPQCSSESYEAMVLNAEECGPDDYCESSNAFAVDLSEKKTDSRYKLKRGTRMKDFQRDILSSLSTLSRQEIREDINIFEGVIRSREYKKMRGKMADGDDWCKPMRSKRSRISRR